MQSQLTDWVRLVHAEYHEMPGLNLTKPQVQRLWGLDDMTCSQVLEALEAEHVLKRTHGDRYILDHSGLDHSGHSHREGSRL